MPSCRTPATRSPSDLSTRITAFFTSSESGPRLWPAREDYRLGNDSPMLALQAGALGALGDAVPDLCNATQTPRLLREALAQGHTGPRAGQGFYHYRAGAAEKWQRLTHRHTWHASRLVADAVNEAESWSDAAPSDSEG